MTHIIKRLENMDGFHVPSGHYVGQLDLAKVAKIEMRLLRFNFRSIHK